MNNKISCKEYYVIVTSVIAFMLFFAIPFITLVLPNTGTLFLVYLAGAFVGHTLTYVTIDGF